MNYSFFLVFKTIFVSKSKWRWKFGRKTKSNLSQEMKAKAWYIHSNIFAWMQLISLQEKKTVNSIFFHKKSFASWKCSTLPCAQNMQQSKESALLYQTLNQIDNSFCINHVLGHLFALAVNPVQGSSRKFK